MKNSKIHIFICDDNSEYIEYLKTVILKSGFEREEICFYEFHTGEDLVKFFHKKDIYCDLAILDMQLPGMNGDETAALFRNKFTDSVLVFCSGVYQPTDKSFKVMAYRYLYKSYTEQKMISEMKEIVHKVRENRTGNMIVAHCRFEKIRLKPTDIMYIETGKHGCKIHVCPDVDMKIKGNLLCNEKLGILYEKLKNSGFEFAHNSYIVNLNYVKQINTNSLVFISWGKEELSLAVSRSKSKEIHRRFARLMSQKYD